MAIEYLATLTPLFSQTAKRAVPLPHSTEIDTLACGLTHRHPAAAVTAACLWQVSEGLLRHFAEVHNVNMHAMLTVQQEALWLWATSQGASTSEMDAALAGLQQAGQTAQYLHSLPD